MNLKRTRPLLWLFLLVATCFLPLGAIAQNISAPLPFINSNADKPVVTTEQVRAELLAWAPDGVHPNAPLWLGLRLDHQPEWHTYWKNSGDSGLPTALQWQLPAGIDAGEIAWPTPKKIPIGTLANYGYEGTVLLPVPLTVAQHFNASQLEVKLRASWLVCRKECIPQEGEFTLRIPARSSTAAQGQLFADTFAASPKSLHAASSHITVANQTMEVLLTGLPKAMRGKTLDFFPEIGGVIEPAGPWRQAWQGTRWTAQIPLSGQRTESPTSLPVVVALQDQAYRIETPVRGEWPSTSAATTTTLSPALQAALQVHAPTTAAPLPSNTLSLLTALVGALLGGLILNFMPCVFPVLAIKLMGFVHLKDRIERARTALAYTAGVVLSFLTLGALLLVFRAAGEQLGWGFQLQNPAVVAALAVLFTLIGLSMAGLFEFGNFLPARVANIQATNPTINAFLSGVLVTAIASPCTAPFMGASLGYAIALPAAQALAVFATIGAGMALPYLVVSTIPTAARVLPKPGKWMLILRQLMAFPMFATVAWLVWVLGQQSGMDGAGALLGLLVLITLTIWAFTQDGRAQIMLSTLSVALLALALWSFGPTIVRLQETAASNQPVNRWQNWEPGRVDQLLTQGQSVFVDFTAAWCVTCQYNKRVTLAHADVLADMAAKNVTLLRADWTRRDPAVTAALSQLGRNGVPVYVIYKPGRAPVVLSEILSVRTLRVELAKL